MTNKEIVFSVMKKHPCVSGAQIHNYALQMFNEDITPQAASSIMRSFVNLGLAAQSPHPMTGRMVYWFTDYGKETFKDELKEA